MSVSTKRQRRAYLGLYGNVGIAKEYCPDCEDHAIVIDGQLQCCDRDAVSAPESIKREACPEQERRLPSLHKRKAQLAAQGDGCFYCERRFGSYVFRGTDVRKLAVCWDHIVPYSYSQDNRDVNFVASCDVCNGIKSSRMFRSVNDAKTEIALRWSDLGWS